ncbi:hypothetical protein IVB02_21355 [Bradyrhizobium sp. 166]|uniref:hypothetical protein n=1 Tax=Bradyrhizobium sp. 166 TaxID=2782638 RepID=UPI001FFA7B3D|nr:hypothetical protein [Bradyrhizobium sp. 166]MCK1603914.1 hypothetical protein [Bradyrhizobium sp. 166]
MRKINQKIALSVALLLAPAANAAEQSSYVTPTAGPMSMSTLAGTYINPALRALASCHWGTSAPANGPGATPIVYQCWADTTTNPVVFKRYDGASWVTYGALNTSTHVWTPYLTGGASGGVPYFSSAGVMGSSAALTQYGFVVGGGAGAAPGTIAACTDDQVAFGRTGNAPLCRSVSGDLTFSAGVSAIGANKVTNAMMRQSGALAVVGRSANSTGNVADIQATAGAGGVLRESGNAIAFGQVATAGIADSAVTNAKLANMAANTTKCNATAGSAAPTDCTASTMRTNLGVDIGTNVEAWDADLDCIAALSSTGVIKRTGAGTCSAGAVALADLATGTQDTVAGYFGSTTVSAVAIGNCSNALTYSTSTHTFGCNTTAGTGTVTSVATAGLVTGGPITSSGTVTVTAAAQSDQETGSSNSVAVTPGTQKYHQSASKAWINLTNSGTTYAAAQAFNVLFSSRAGAGLIDVTFPTAFSGPDSYGCVGTSTPGLVVGFPSANKTASGLRIDIRTSAGAQTDSNVFLSCFGDQ